jgi:hypothetical protein
VTNRRTVAKALMLAPAIWTLGRIETALAAAERVALPKTAPLSAAEWATIAAVVDLLLPRAEGFPSGTDAGVVAFFHKGFASELPAWRRFLPGRAAPTGLAVYIPHYRELAKRLETLAKKRNGSKVAFSTLADESRAATWKAFTESEGAADVGYRITGVPPAKESTDSQLYDLARRHALMGYFSEPANGGNRDYVAWEALSHVCHLNYPKPAPSSCEGKRHLQ